jgi:DNA polymerase-3 subunit gamma/tau
MVVVRLAHAADLPTPDEAARMLKGEGAAARGDNSAARGDGFAAGGDSRRPNGAGAARAASAGGRADARAVAAPVAAGAPAVAAATPAVRIASFADLVAFAGRERDLKMKHALENYIRINSFEQGRIEIGLTGEAPADLVGSLSKKLEQWTGQRWMITVSRNSATETIAESQRFAQEKLLTDARADPVVAAVLERFPGAEIVDVRVRQDDAGIRPAADSDNDINDETDEVD